MIIYLIRHGQSWGNVLGNKYSTIKGQKDNTSLTKKGKKQIEKIAGDFKNKKIAIRKIFTSPLKRAYQSALIFKNFFPKIKIIKNENLIEIKFGKLERKKWEEIKEEYQSWINQYLKDRFNTPFPEGESRKDLYQRLERFIKKNITDKKGNYLIIAHEEVIRAFLSFFANNKIYFFERKTLPKIDNASVSSLWQNKKSKLIFQINDNQAFYLKENQFKDLLSFLKENSLDPIFIKKEKSYSDNFVFSLLEKKGSKYILKLIPLYKEKQVKKEIFLCRYFKKINFPTPFCLKMKKGKSFIFHLRYFINDRLGDEFIKEKKFQKRISFFMGKILKKIHQKTKKLKNNLYFRKLIQFYQNDSWINDFLLPWIDKDKQTLYQIDYPKKEFLKDIYHDFLKKNNLKVNEGLIYFDFHPQNFTVKLVNNNFVLSGIWDFENVFWGDTYFDLAYTIKLSFFKNQKLINQFLKGYFGKRIEKEKKSIIYFYLLLVITGSITYKKTRGLNYHEEIENLNYFLNHYQKFIKK